MSWTISKRFTFEAAHRLEYHDGRCKDLHGHTYHLIVEMNGGALHDTGPKQGMLYDFTDIGLAVKHLIREYLDHRYLNETLDMETTTAEKIAEWVYRRLSPVLGNELTAVTIEETESSSATYRPTS